MSRPPIRLESKERDVKKLITDWLDAKHIQWHRMQVGRKGRVKFGEKGMADLLVVYRCTYRPEGCKDLHRVIWIETKREKGGKGQSEDQREFQSRVLANGQEYILARSLEDVEKGIL